MQFHKKSLRQTRNRIHNRHQKSRIWLYGLPKKKSYTVLIRFSDSSSKYLDKTHYWNNLQTTHQFITLENAYTFAIFASEAACKSQLYLINGYLNKFTICHVLS